MDKVLSGKPIGTLIKNQVSELISQKQLSPTMLLIQVGSDPASEYYVQSIIKSGKKLGCEVKFLELSSETKEQELIDVILAANNDPEVDGIMLQKPLPKGFDTTKIDICINPDKDVDATHPLNLGRIMNETNFLLPCTAAAVIETLRFYEIKPSGKHVVILGRSTVLGKPLANLLIQKNDFANATVTICHSKTENIGLVTKNADILVAAIGVPEFVKSDMIKPGAILIDVGINLVRDPSGATAYVGDIDYKACFDKALAITPVPGGIGTITTAILFRNLANTAFLNSERNKSIDDFS